MKLLFALWKLYEEDLGNFISLLIKTKEFPKRTALPPLYLSAILQVASGWVSNMTTMQKLLQLPVNAVNIVKTVQSQVQGQEEVKSPVLTPDSGQHAWYNALQPDELRHLRSGGTGEGGRGGGGGGGGGDQEERGTLEEGGGGGGGGGGFQTQPLR